MDPVVKTKEVTMSHHFRNNMGVCRWLGLLAIALSLAACNPTFTVGGTVTGLAGTGLVLQNNSGDDLAVTSNGSFTFAKPLKDKGTYTVAMKEQPTAPRQICEVSNDSGWIAGRNVTGVVVMCKSVYSVGGTVSGLAGAGLMLQNDGGDDLAVTGNGAFTFATILPSGSSYSVTVLQQPYYPETCVVENGTGIVTSGDITNVAVTCTPQMLPVGGAVLGL